MALRLQHEEVELAGIVIHETDKAWLIDFGTQQNHWMPKSEVRKDDNDFIVPYWLAHTKGLI